ncbi:hypothetical protein F5Y16DRAFT_392919 [Xylariaceae sp. FL0255]|nr:hypothetical protein F5Y16DRAFT_392919 [Xylariaceae sp. FL0255]
MFYCCLEDRISRISTLLDWYNICRLQRVQIKGNAALLGLVFWFSAVVIVLFVLVFAVLCWTWIWKIAREWRYAIHDRLRLVEEGRAK